MNSEIKLTFKNLENENYTYVKIEMTDSYGIRASHGVKFSLPTGKQDIRTLAFMIKKCGESLYEKAGSILENMPDKEFILRWQLRNSLSDGAEITFTKNGKK